MNWRVCGLMMGVGGLLLGTDLQANEWRDGPGFRVATLVPVLDGQAGFSVLSAAQTGIDFTNRLAESRYLTNQILLNGSGVAAGDEDGDGWCDLYFCGLDGPNVLYRNRGGFRFEEVTAQAGVGVEGQPSSGAALADVDGDGDLDLLVNGIGTGTRLFQNDGQGVFAEVTTAAGLRGGTGSASMALADVDGDGDLDLYVVNYRTTTFRDEPNKRFSVATAGGKFDLVAVDGRSVKSPELRGRFSVDPVTGVLENGEADVLYLNDGSGRFAAVDWTDGTFRDENGQPIGIPYDWGLSAMFRDLNGDGAPDLYVCNDFQSPDRIWINDGRGHFRAIARLAVRQTSIFSMGIDFADLDRDGHDDFLVADMLSRRHALRQVQLMERQPAMLPIGTSDNRPQYSRNTLFRNRGDGTFAEIAQLSGVEAADWAWCPVFLDVDLDGFEDLLFVTGHVRDAQNIDVARRIDALTKSRKMTWAEQLQLRRMFTRLEVPNFAFRNRGDWTFEETGHAWGFDSLKVSQGIALADLDNDGDLDLAINCLDDGALIYRNESSQARVAVSLRGKAPNTRGIGARITVHQPGRPSQSQEMMAGGRYVSSDAPLRVFAASGIEPLLTIEVRWRSGLVSRLTNALPNQHYEIDENGAATPLAPTVAPSGPPLFEDVSDRLAHRHHEENFDDFNRQALLPHKLSQLGPGVGWFDVDGDGREDAIVGSGRGGRLGVFRNAGQGRFVPLSPAPLPTIVTRDQTTVLGWQPAPGRRALVAGSANYEDGLPQGPVVRQFDLAAGVIDDRLPGQVGSSGPLALADVDADGDLDLFVGGRVIAGRFPEPASSLLFRNESGRLQLDAEVSQAFAEAGLVSGATFSDLDGDGLPELVLATEWGPLKIFRNERGRFAAWNPSLVWIEQGSGKGRGPGSLRELTGAWNSVAAGDFDGDGRMDLLAGNWGRNTHHQKSLAAPVHLLHGDLDEDGIVEAIEAYRDPELRKLVPRRDWDTLARALPFLLERYDSYTAFSTAGIEEMLGDRRTQFRDLTMVTLDSVLLLNRGDRFEARPLPLEVQVSPVFGIAVADFDGDGCEDAFLSQNFFAVAPLTSRHDAGLGVLLRGDGKGGWVALSASASGVRVYGEGRGAAVGDFDQDGRPDLLVGQNGEATRLFRNQGGRPGLRVRLEGPAGNPEGIGSRVWMTYADGTRGPTREVRAGSGYWSQDSSVAVIGLAGEPKTVTVRWPGGRLVELPVAPGARELRIR
ncbi:MAG: FG-GAP-like repeat-containing protein [Limisphaerales bacterium]